MANNEIQKTTRNYGYIRNKFDKWWTDFTSTIPLIAKSWVKDPQGISSTFVIPTFFFIIFYFLLKSPANNNNLLGYTMLPALTVLISLSAGLASWKNSVFLKRIDTTGISKGTFLFSIWSFYLVVGMIGIFFELLVGLIIAQKDAISQYQALKWGWFILGSIFTNLLSIGLATLIVGLISSQGAVQGLSMVIYFISMFLSGMMIPYEIVGRVTALRIISYFIPHLYANGVVSYASAEAWMMFDNPNLGYHVFTQIWQPSVGAAGLIAVLFAVNAFTFRWSK